MRTTDIVFVVCIILLVLMIVVDSNIENDRYDQLMGENHSLLNKQEQLKCKVEKQQKLIDSLRAAKTNQDSIRTKYQWRQN